MQRHHFTSKSTVMHACLAYLAPEIQTMDSIIRSSSTWHTPALPTEILLLIRETLFPLIMSQLVQKSTAALEAYEHSLRNLLCPDCIVYNLEIYGPNIWHWEQFHGPCACLQIESPSPHTVQVSPRPQLISMANPKQCRDAQHWLEEHLSREATAKLSIKSWHRLRPMQSSAVSPSASETTIDIWSVIAFVLQEYNCEFVPLGPEEVTSSHADGTQLRLCDVVRIIPMGHIVKSINGGNPESGVAVRSAVRSWPVHTTWIRAVRELCLDSIEPFGTHSRDPSSFKRLLRCPDPSIVQGQGLLQVSFSFMASIVAGCLFLPITCTTIAVSVFYFYSRPRSCKIF